MLGAAREALSELRARAQQPVDPEAPPQGVESLLEYQESCQKCQSPHVCVVQDGQHLEPGTAEYDNMVFKKMVCTMSVWISQPILDHQQDDFLKVQAEILAPAWRLDAKKKKEKRPTDAKSDKGKAGNPPYTTPAHPNPKKDGEDGTATPYRLPE